MSSVSTQCECFLVFHESEQNIFWFLYSPSHDIFEVVLTARIKVQRDVRR